MAGAAEERREAAAYSPISNPFAPRPKALTPPGIGLASLAGLAASSTSMSPDALPPTDSPSGWRLQAGWAGGPAGGDSEARQLANWAACAGFLTSCRLLMPCHAHAAASHGHSAHCSLQTPRLGGTVPSWTNSPAPRSGSKDTGEQGRLKGCGPAASAPALQLSRTCSSHMLLLATSDPLIAGVSSAVKWLAGHAKSASASPSPAATPGATPRTVADATERFTPRLGAASRSATPASATSSGSAGAAVGPSPATQFPRSFPVVVKGSAVTVSVRLPACCWRLAFDLPFLLSTPRNCTLASAELVPSRCRCVPCLAGRWHAAGRAGHLAAHELAPDQARRRGGD